MIWKVQHPCSSMVKVHSVYSKGYRFESHQGCAFFHLMECWLFIEQMFTVENRCSTWFETYHVAIGINGYFRTWLYIYLTTYIQICLSTYLSIHLIYLIYIFTSLRINHISVYVLISSSSIKLSTYPSLQLPFCMSLCVSIILPYTYPSIYLPAFLSARPFVHLPI